MCLAIPGQIETITSFEEFNRMGRVNFGGIVKEINLSYVPEADEGDWVIVHAGFAISALDAEEAEQILADLEEIDSLGETDASK